MFLALFLFAAPPLPQPELIITEVRVTESSTKYFTWELSTSSKHLTYISGGARSDLSSYISSRRSKKLDQKDIAEIIKLLPSKKVKTEIGIPALNNERYLTVHYGKKEWKVYISPHNTDKYKEYAKKHEPDAIEIMTLVEKVISYLD